MLEGGRDLLLRPADLDDASFVADMWTALHPDSPQDPVLTRYRWAQTPDDGRRERHIVMCADSPIGYLARHTVGSTLTPPGYVRLEMDVLPEERSERRLRDLIAAAEARATATGARHGIIRVREDDRVKRSAFAAAGYQEQLRTHLWELDLAANRWNLAEMARVSRRHVRDRGFQVMTLADLHAPNGYERVWRIAEQPSIAPEPAERTLEQGHVLVESGNPGLHEDRVWIACLDAEVVGVSMLSYPPVRGVVMTEWTATAPQARRQGVARALKCEALVQAYELGVHRVRTDIDPRNEPIAHLNKMMGYRPCAWSIDLVGEFRFTEGAYRPSE